MRSFSEPAVAAGVTGLAHGYRHGLFDPTQVCAAYFDRVERHDTTLNAFVALDTTGASCAAQASSERHASGRPLGPLDGIPIGVKANIAVRGLPWTAGVAAWADRISTTDAAVVEGLRAEGALIMGTLNMDEAAFGAATDNPRFGRTANPHCPGASAGGSSGGPAAAVASGLCAAALGSDTMGSIRIPAAYCGIAGFVPSARHLSQSGVVPLAPSFDRLGWLARSIGDLTMLHTASAGTSPTDEPGPRVAALSSEDLLLRPDLRRSYEHVLGRLTARGMRVETISLSEYAPATAARALLIAVEIEAHAVYEELLAARSDAVSTPLRGLLEWGGRLPAARRDAVREQLGTIDRAVRAALSPYAALLLPTTLRPAFDFTAGHPTDAAWLTALASICHMPAATVPTGLDGARRPLALQVVAWSDTAALSIAGFVEQACAGLGAPLRFIN